MGSVYRPTYKAKDGKRRKGKTYRIAWVDENGDRQTEGASTDKRAAEEILRQKESRVERIKANLPVDGAGQLHRPIVDAVEELTAELRRLGRSPGHIGNVRRIVKAVSVACGWKQLRDIAIDRFRAHLATLQDGGMATSSLNQVRGKLVAFCNFCLDQKWLSSNPLSRVKAATGGKRPHRRRALTILEFGRLISCPEIPAKRRLLYHIAGVSGLRRGEMSQAQKRDVTFEPAPPRWRLRPEIVKTRRLDIAKMTEDAIELVRPLWDTLDDPTDRLFGVFPEYRTLNTDLKRAGIPKRDSQDRVVNAHSLRYFFCSFMGLRLPIQEVRILMRHRTIKMTVELYMDLGIDDAAELTTKLPRISEALQQAQMAELNACKAQP